jgi:hypothetical protein
MIVCIKYIVKHRLVLSFLLLLLLLFLFFCQVFGLSQHR